jgi:diguanylate cyclase (GGDEF)-like protein
VRADSFFGRLVAALARSTPAFRPDHKLPTPPYLDQKTGVLTMRSWSESAADEITRASWSDSPVGLLLVDMDRFKTVNDTWGHLAGDAVLSAVGEALRTGVDRNGLVGRFGGEEFVVLLPASDIEQSVLIAERLRASIVNLTVSATDSRGELVVIAGQTASIGVSGIPRHGHDLTGLLQAADSAVSMAKASGRNVVRVAGSGEKADEHSPIPQNVG